jgi:hypothetical protein
LHGAGFFLVTEFPGKNIASIFTYQAIQIPTTFLCCKIIAQNKATMSTDSQTVFICGEENDLAARTDHQIHITSVYPYLTYPAAIYSLQQVYPNIFCQGTICNLINIYGDGPIGREV